MVREPVTPIGFFTGLSDLFSFVYLAFKLFVSQLSQVKPGRFDQSKVSR